MMNAISVLKEYHEKYKKEESPPVYVDDESSSDGEFTVVCKFLKINVKGHGKRKKDAKCEAANQMLSLIKLQQKDLIETSTKKSLQTDNEFISVKPLANNEFQKHASNGIGNISNYDETRDVQESLIKLQQMDLMETSPKKSLQTDNEFSSVKPKSNNVFTKPEVSHIVCASDVNEFKENASDGIGYISNYDEICNVQDVNVGFSDYDMIITNPSDSPIKQFLSVMKSLNMKYSYSILPSNKGRVSLIIKLSHHHIASGYSARTEGEAIQVACQRILEMIKVFSK